MISPSLVTQAFAASGKGLLMLGMMSRVSLGHTGRSVISPPAILRVFLPFIMPSQYLLWIGGAQLAWISAFSLFLWVYWSMLWRLRIDGKSG